MCGEPLSSVAAKRPLALQISVIVSIIVVSTRDLSAIIINLSGIDALIIIIIGIISISDKSLKAQPDDLCIVELDFSDDQQFVCNK